MPDMSSIPVGNIAAIGFLLLTGFYIVYYLVLRYHWISYTSDKRVATLTMVLFACTTAPLIILMGVMTLLLL